ncbi:hypothetical protein TNCV_4395761 [Trichonephila clavipes]|uniref:Uncharacterized protein n=1 Tax=Trichonephila clavipes TaxID=2585209 RepID=A0A8X6W583_TRICX|nr:hypothetical protein TNCV_4395761 [Trichonephila clavipes]
MRWRIVGEIATEDSLKSTFVHNFLKLNIMFNLWKQFQDTRSVKRNPGQGCPRATTSRENLHLSITVRRNRDATVSQRILYGKS